MRKGVEYTLGILKGRWRIQETGIRQHNVKDVDNIWFTCCALHNMLLVVDGLHTLWNNGVKGYDKGIGGRLDAADVANYVNPAVFARLNGQLDMHDSSTIIDPSTILPVERDYSASLNPLFIRKLSRENFRGKLVTSFSYRFIQKKDIVWPSRTGKVVPAI